MLHQRSLVGIAEGAKVGKEEGMPEGSILGEAEGFVDGVIEGFALGIFVGAAVGILVGNFVGFMVGILVETGVLTYAMVSFSSLDSDRPSVKTGTYTILTASLGRLEGAGV